jgi:hypothetical protein
MSDNTLQKLVKKAGEERLKGGVDTTALADTKSSVEKQATLRFISQVLYTLAWSLGLSAFAFKDSWIVGSPLFNVVGAVACLLLLLPCIFFAAVWWLITGSACFWNWVDKTLPFGVQPFRSQIGLFFILTVCMPLCIRYLKRLRYTQLIIIYLKHFYSLSESKVITWISTGWFCKLIEMINEKGKSS